MGRELSAMLHLITIIVFGVGRIRHAKCYIKENGEVSLMKTKKEKENKKKNKTTK